MKICVRTTFVVASLLSLAVAAAEYPAKPIRVIVPWPAGGSTDTLARIVGQRLTTLVGQPIVIDNRAGASGTIGVDIASKAIPDGYTITIVEAAHAVMPATTLKLPYDLARDLAPLTLIGVSPNLVYINAALPVDESDIKLRPILQAALRVVPLLQFHSAATIQQMQFPPTSRKQVKFIDSRETPAP